jgi:hypothetical protein
LEPGGGVIDDIGLAGKGVGAWVRSTESDPVPEKSDLILRQFLFWRHLEGGIRVFESPEKEAGIWIPRDDGGAGITPIEKTLAGIEVETAFKFFGLSAMAGVAMLLQKGLNLVLEELQTIG